MANLIRICASCKRKLIGASGDASGAPVTKEYESENKVTHTFCDECLQKRYPSAWMKIQQARTTGLDNQDR